ncbi:hypothetical protein [Agrobacterium sp. DE0009]|uniref:hypothetical protein n=1 Tax=Agrobacterium sp. DE0009 TaxID=2587505 RepID=UPI0011A98F5B|nr:hypothetical protein [Agrobacterium sp. DE0009]
MTTASGIQIGRAYQSQNRVRDQRLFELPAHTLRSRRKSNGASLNIERPEKPNSIGGDHRGSGHDGASWAGYAVLGFSEPVQRHFGASCPQLMQADGGRRFTDDGIPVHENIVGYQIDIAFEIAREYPFVGEDIATESVSKAIAGVYPVLVAFNGYRHHSGRLARIDHAEIIMEPTPIPCVDLSGNVDVRAVVQREGRTAWDVTSMLVRPLRALLWTAERLREEGSWLKKGDIVTSGTYPFLLDIRPGDRLTADVVGKAEISHRFENGL